MDEKDSSLNKFNKAKRSITYHFMYHYMAIILVIIIATFSGVLMLGQHFLYQEKQELLLERTKEIAKSVDYYLSQNDHEGLYRYMSLADRLADADLWIFDTDSDLIAVTGFSRLKSNVTKNLSTVNKIPSSSPKNSPLLFDISKEELGEKTVQIIDDVSKGDEFVGIINQKYYGEDVVVAAAPYYDTINGRLGTVMLTVPVAHYQGFLNQLYLVIACVGIVAILMAWVLTRRMSKSIISPIVFMKEFAMKLAGGQYGDQLELNEDSEINELGGALNTLSIDLANYTENLERHEKVRKDFVANVSHELKTPITIIRGYNDALIDGVIKDEEKKAKYRKLINDETIRIERLVKDLLNMSRLENSDPWEVDNLTPVSLTELCRNIAERLGIRCIENNVEIKVEAKEEIRILGDGDQLLQLILILTDNALKYSPQNGIVLICAYKSEDDGVVLSVSDNGPGIPEEDVEFLWDRFYMVDKSRNRMKVQGTGLGLAIAKQIIRIHGAEAHVYSKLGEGTKFEIKFPKDKIV